MKKIKEEVKKEHVVTRTFERTGKNILDLMLEYFEGSNKEGLSTEKKEKVQA